MQKNYTHLSEEQRYQIHALLLTGLSQKRIANIIGKSESCISRELKRNTPSKGRGAFEYRAINAVRLSKIRQRKKPKKERFTEEMKIYIRQKLMNEHWSPEIISHEGKNELGDFISHEWIYQWIWICKSRARPNDRNLYKYLAHCKRRKRRGHIRETRGIMINRVSIEQRPKIVEKRKRLGDIEVDLMMGKKLSGAILVALDRTSLQSRLRLLRDRNSNVIESTLKKMYKRTNWIKTITFDNDKAFMRHESIAEHFGAKAYFTRPYTSQDKGSVENRIGVIRRFFPKGIDLRKVTDKQVKLVEQLINNRPVRKFKYKTPNQIFSEKIALTT
jgi:IS30 family transposase